uniref:uncharacterized protein LOC120329035 isoform X1 n=1 Tax=Styela clava TaxID=7725 RepID=UPI001939382C|nr:uncharacterized protein LOC120329035 isoform X1 [Styela clava]
MDLEAIEEAMLQAALRSSLNDAQPGTSMIPAVAEPDLSSLNSMLGNLLGSTGGDKSNEPDLSDLSSLSSMMGNLLSSAGGDKSNELSTSSSTAGISNFVHDYTIQTPSTAETEEDSAILLLKRDFVIEERARALASNSKYYEATSILEELLDMEDTTFGVKLLIADCYLQLGRENKATKAVNGIRKIILKSSFTDVNEILDLAQVLTANKCHVRALILYKIASDVAVKDSSLKPDDKVENIFRSMALMHHAITEMIEPENSGAKLQRLLQNLSDKTSIIAGSTNQRPTVGTDRKRILALDFGVEYMNQMLEDLQTVEGADPDRQTLKQAWCINYIGFELAAMGENAKSDKVRSSGIAVMEKLFGAHASLHKIYGILLHNLGIVLHNQEKYREAEKAYVRAIEAKENALDHDDANDKRRDIELVKQALKVTRQHLK